MRPWKRAAPCRTPPARAWLICAAVVITIDKRDLSLATSHLGTCPQALRFHIAERRTSAETLRNKVCVCFFDLTGCPYRKFKLEPIDDAIHPLATAARDLSSGRRVEAVRPFLAVSASEIRCNILCTSCWADYTNTNSRRPTPRIRPGSRHVGPAMRARASTEVRGEPPRPISPRASRSLPESSGNDPAPQDHRVKRGD
jgi:hypothetical protein